MMKGTTNTMSKSTVIIKSLSKEQEAQFPVYVDRWKKIGLSTDRMDRDKAIASVKKAYALAGLKEPTNFYFTKSPADAVNFIRKNLDKKATPSTIISQMIYGAHEAAWLSFYSFFKEQCNLEACNKLDGLMELAEHSGWLSVYEDTVVFQERPTAIRFDDQDRLHCETGPAIEYEDGFGVYSWHGVKIPKEWITSRETLTPKIALGWSNIEQRRAACEIVTWARILRELDAKVIDADEDPMIGTLVEVNIPDVGSEKFLKVICGTGREFAIPVPPTMTKALDANAWTFDIDGDTLRKLEVRT
jgi:hypothetical protein